MCESSDSGSESVSAAYSDEDSEENSEMTIKEETTKGSGII